MECMTVEALLYIACI